MLFLNEAEVRQLLTMEDALEAVEAAFRSLTLEQAANVPRARVRAERAVLHTMSAAGVGYLGYKAYVTGPDGVRFHVNLYDGRTGAGLAVMQADYLGQVRTGAASGVATAYLARPDAAKLGIFGSGKQARTQLLAVSKVRKLSQVHVYSPDEERRRLFAEEMTGLCGVEVEPVRRPELAAQDKDIIVTATNSKEPVLFGKWIAEGAHLNVIGSNYLSRAEIDASVVWRSDLIVVDSKEQAALEAGDFVKAVEEGALHSSNVYELGEVILNRGPGRTTPKDITLFKSVGIALEDVAVAAKVFQKAKVRGLGQEIPDF